MADPKMPSACPIEVRSISSQEMTRLEDLKLPDSTDQIGLDGAASTEEPVAG